MRKPMKMTADLVSFDERLFRDLQEEFAGQTVTEDIEIRMHHYLQKQVLMLQERHPWLLGIDVEMDILGEGPNKAIKLWFYRKGE